MNVEQVLAECLAAHDAAALAQWQKAGEQDCGSCGGYMLGYRANSKFAKAMLAAGVGLKMEQVYLSRREPEGIRSQHYLIEEKAKRAFQAKAAEHGIMAAKAWSYVD
jgi:hypothetical protein